jgi:hypothetical protein
LISIICGVTEKRSPPLSLMKMAKVSLGDAVEGAREAAPSKPTPEQFVADSPTPPAHFTGAHASRLTMRTKLWRLFQAIRVLLVRAGPMVRIRLPPPTSQGELDFRGWIPSMTEARGVAIPKRWPPISLPP